MIWSPRIGAREAMVREGNINGGKAGRGGGGSGGAGSGASGGSHVRARSSDHRLVMTAAASSAAPTTLGRSATGDTILLPTEEEQLLPFAQWKFCCMNGWKRRRRNE